MNQITEHGCLYSAEDKTLTAACKRLLQQQSFSTPESTARETRRHWLYRYQPIDRLSYFVTGLALSKFRTPVAKRCTASP